MQLTDLPERFIDKIAVSTTGCWEWTGSQTKEGYGRVAWEGKVRGAHRVTYTLLVGPIPDGLTIDHIVCDNPPCVNPAHLVPATGPSNTRRGGNAVKTHCWRGHEFTPANTRFSERRRERSCRACDAIRRREYLARKVGH